jgi:hypothetical protein
MRDYIFKTLFKALYDIRDFFGGLIAPNLWWLQLVSLLISVLFLLGIIYIFIKTSYFEMKKEQFLDILGRGYVSKSRSLRGWKQIQKRMQSKEQNQWKLAILEADRILDEILKMSGYLQKNLDEKLELITPAQLANAEDVKRAHRVRNKIAEDPTSEISREEAESIIKVYKQAFKELNLIRE